jgi:uncharacterized protein DUF4407
MNNINYFFWWMAGSDKDCLEVATNRARKLHTALGIAFLVNFVLLMIIWTKVGIHFFGFPGIVLGLLIPCGLVLGIDRIIAMRPRPLRGELAVYGIRNDRGTITETIIRVFLSAVLCIASTFTFQLVQSHSLIAAKAADNANNANRALRQEMVEQIIAVNKKHQDLIAMQEKSKTSHLANLIETQREATNTEHEALTEARNAQGERIAEIAGHGSYAKGDGPKAKGHKKIADLNEAIAAEARRRKEVTTRTINQVSKELLELKTQVMKSESEKNLLLDGVAEKMRTDPRYVAQKSGLFAEATIFVRLFNDPDVAAGIWVTSIMTFGILFVLELIALVALLLTPSSSYDIALLVKEIRQGAILSSNEKLSNETADTMASIAFTNGLDDKFEDIKRAEELARKAGLTKAVNDIRKKQTEELSPLDVRLSAVPTGVDKGKNMKNDDDLNVGVAS